VNNLAKLLVAVFVFAATDVQTGSSQIIPDGLYFGQSPPGLTPEVFAPGIISMEDRYEYVLVFSPDLDECVFGLTDRTWGIFSLMYTSMGVDSSWIDPFAAPFVGDGDGLLPAYSPDGDEMFFVSSRPSWPAVNVWHSERVDSAWSDPVELPSPVNTNSAEFGLSLANDETLYFTSDRSSGYGQQDIYRSIRVGGEYPSVENLGPPVNTQYNDASPHIAPDQSYLIFESNRPGGYGQVDLYLSFFEEGNWTEPVNLGPTINTDQIDDAAGVSPDGKYMFFNRRRSYVTYEDTDIYWVDIEAVFPDSSVGIDEMSKNGLPRAFTLHQNYPNPFNPSTTIGYDIPKGDAKLPVKVFVYDIRGRLVRKLLDQEKEPGAYQISWDGHDERENRVASGVYFYIIRAGDFSSTRKMVIRK